MFQNSSNQIILGENRKAQLLYIFMSHKGWTRNIHLVTFLVAPGSWGCKTLHPSILTFRHYFHFIPFVFLSWLTSIKREHQDVSPSTVFQNSATFMSHSDACIELRPVFCPGLIEKKTKQNPKQTTKNHISVNRKIWWQTKQFTFFVFKKKKKFSDCLLGQKEGQPAKDIY